MTVIRGIRRANALTERPPTSQGRVVRVKRVTVFAGAKRAGFCPLTASRKRDRTIMKARSRQLLSIAALTCIGVAPLAAQAEPEDWGDHPMVPRIEGSEILSYDYTELDRVTLTFGPREDGEFVGAREIEG